MLKILERKIALQLLVFYGLFVIPLLLGGAELYFFQRDALQQSAQQADLGLAQAIAQDVGTHGQNTAALTQLNAHLVSIQQQLSSNGEVRIWVLDMHGTLVASANGNAPGGNLLHHIPGLHNALLGKSGHLIAQDQQRDWLYSYVPVSGTDWTVIVGRPGDVTFATVISFQHSLIIALLMLIAGASVFWFVMHGWVVAPLSRLAQAATLIKPDQDVKVTDSRLLRREKSRQDEIGRLVNAFSTMEDEIHTLFQKSDARSYTRLQTLDAIMRSMDEGVLLEDSEGRIIYANYRYTQFVGISARDTLPETLQGHHREEYEAYLEAMMESPETYHTALHRAECGEGEPVVEFRVTGYYNKLGQFITGRRDIRMRLFEVRDMMGQVIGRGKIYNDVTRQNEAEQIKKNLLAIASHELRTPLTAIKGYATSLLETDIELDAYIQRDFLQRIVQEEDRMAELVTNLLEMSQLEAGTLKMVPSNCRLDSLIARAIEAAKVKRERISLSLPAEIPQLYVDRRRIEMVLRNLLENAQKYAGNEAKIEITARYTNNQEDEGLYVSIADNGSGLPDDLTERIFDSFYQIDGGRERSSSGVGLGLAICRGFIEAHGGRIWAENRTGDNSGAIFHIWLPVRLLHTTYAIPNHFDLEKAL